MGTYYSYNQGLSLKDYVAEELGACQDIIDYSIIGSCAYILYGRQSGLRSIEVWKLTRHEGCPGYKPMSEEMGPYYHDCPKRILDGAGPTDSADANQWRAACHAKRERKNLIKRIKPGDIIETESGEVYTARHYRGVRGRACIGYHSHRLGRLYRLPRLANEPLRIIKLISSTLYRNTAGQVLVCDDSRAPGPGIWWVLCDSANCPIHDIDTARQVLANGFHTLRRYDGV